MANTTPSTATTARTARSATEVTSTGRANARQPVNRPRIFSSSSPFSNSSVPSSSTGGRIQTPTAPSSNCSLPSSSSGVACSSSAASWRGLSGASPSCRRGVSSFPTSTPRTHTTASRPVTTTKSRPPHPTARTSVLSSPACSAFTLLGCIGELQPGAPSWLRKTITRCSCLNAARETTTTATSVGPATAIITFLSNLAFSSRCDALLAWFRTCGL
mmetsp:Transcript_2625/g.8191  ORF Transcript_2625/g.8191 Transcript_2625/m.8191 type:complete len:216 (+) Transcript_2625:791-1438(+)